MDETGTVAALTHEGEGIVRGGKTAFIAGALPGEKITFRRTRSHRQHDEARLIEVLEPSRDRVEPRCMHFGVCGGCALQHLSPEAQLAAKEQELRDNFERLAHVSPERWLEPLRGPVWGYRRRARLGAKYVPKKGRVVVGFRERSAPYVADLRACHVLAPPANELIAPLSELLTLLEIRDRLPQIEVAVAEGATALVFRVLAPPGAADLDRLRRFESEHGVRIYLQPGGLDSVRPLNEDSATDGSLHYALPDFGLDLRFEPTDFIQVNGVVNAMLVSRALELLELTPEAKVLDLFCGIGNFTLPLARRAARAVGVEGDAALVMRARRNSAVNGVTNAEFHRADLAQSIATQDWAKEGFSHVLLDPPRAGAREVLGRVAELEPRRVLYISCHPGSLARDVGMLVHDHRFVLRAAGVLDMFPHTLHVESMAVLEPDRRRGKR